MNNHDKKKILISGAGIAGLTLAYWLNKDGHCVTLVEKSSENRHGGYKVDIRGAALEVLKRMGIYPDLVAKNVNIQKSQFITSDEKVHTFDDDILGHSSEGDIEVNRWDLSQIIANAIEDLSIIYGDSISTIDKQTGEVQFKQSPPQQYDIIVGADGTYSNVRKLVFGDHSTFLLKTGIHFCVFPSENILDLHDTEAAYLQKGKMIAAYCVKESSFVCFAFKGEKQRLSGENKKDIFHEQFKDLGWKSNQLIERMKQSNDCYFGSVDQVRMTSWHSGRVVLIGDSAHAAHGIATSLAIVGAYILSRELKNHNNIAIAFDMYQSALWDFVKNGQNMSESNTAILSQSDSMLFTFKLFLLQRLPKIFLKFLTKKAKKKMKECSNNIIL